MNYRDINRNIFISIQSVGISSEIELDLNTKISDLNFDSLDSLEFIMELEKVFIIEIQDSDAEILFSRENLTIKDIKDFLRDKFHIEDFREERKNKLQQLKIANSNF